jgi:23S rRNA pseudouridine1911/1915/1917 synthase
MMIGGVLPLPSGITTPNGIEVMYFFHPKWPVFHLDNHLLVLYKPAGVRMQRDKPGKLNMQDLAKIWLKKHFQKPGRVFAALVHRLDAPVAGVVVLARTSKAAARLSEQFRLGTINKTYLAVVQGRPPHLADRLVNALERHGRFSRIVDVPGPAARHACLTYRTEVGDDQHTLLEVDLETGRHHQIRVQLAAMGCPVLGDTAYGADTLLPDGRIALMARRLVFDHPTQKNRLACETALPAGWPFPATQGDRAPLWTLEDFQKEGLELESLKDEAAHMA